MSRHKRVWIGSLVLNLFLAGLLFGQRADRAVITGLVSDPVGAAVPQAKVTIRNDQTGVETVVMTNDAGNYTSPLLILGTYTVRVERDGFKAFSRSGIQLTPGAVFRQDATLELGAVIETVEVVAASEMIKTATAETAHTVNEKYYEDLPVVMGADIRLAESLLYMQPGFTPMAPNGDSMFRGSQFNSRINGGQTMAAENWFDGAAFGYAEGHQQTQESSPPIEAIKEVKVSTGVLSAQYGRTSGGFTEYVTKSGTNELHGSVYGFYINRGLRARHFFERQKDPLNQKTLGFTLGGPIRKDKTHFFTNLDFMALQQIPIAGFVHTLPVNAFRQGDFSALLNLSNQVGTDVLGRPIFQGQIFDPTTTRIVNGLPVRDAFGFDPVTGQPTANANIIPAGHPLLNNPLNNVLVPLIPPTERDGLTLNTQGAFGDAIRYIDVYTWLFRLDHQFSPTFKMTHTFFMNERPGKARNCEGPDHCAFNVNEVGKSSIGKNPDYIGHGFFQRIANRFAHQQFDWIIKPNVFNHTLISYDRWVMEGHHLGAGANWNQRLGKGLLDNEAAPGQFNFGGGLGYAFLGNPWQVSTGMGGDVNNRWQFLDDLTWITGKHTVKVGFEYRRHQIMNNGWGGNNGGTFNFNRLSTAGYDAAGNNVGATGDPFAAFLLGQVFDANFSIRTQPMIYEGYYAPWYHHEYKITPKLTLNFGVRWDYQTGKVEKWDRWSTFDPTVPNPGAGGLPGAVVFAGSGPGASGRRSFEDPSRDSWGPRFGFAYRLSDRNVVRGGYGIYYAGISVSQFNSLPVIGFESNPTAPNVTNGLCPAYFFGGNPGGTMNLNAACGSVATAFPQDRIIFPPFIDPTISNGGSPVGIPADSVNLPRYQNWSLSVQRQVTDNMLLDISYVGNRGTRLPAHRNILGTAANMNDPAVLDLGVACLQSDVNDPAQLAANCPAGSNIAPPYVGFVGNVAQAIRPFPQYQIINWRNVPAGSSIYHSLQTTLDKRFSNGLQFRVAHVWSKLINNGAETGQAGDGRNGRYQNPVNSAVERGLSDDDVPHVLIIAYTYELPFGRGKRLGTDVSSIVNKFIGGWKVAALQRYESGRPLPIVMDNDLGGLLFNPQRRPNRLSGGVWTGGDFDPNADRYLTLDGWADPGTRTLGNAPRVDGSVRRFPLYAEDFNLFKETFVYQESVRLRFEVSFGNIFNRAYFCAPDSSVRNFQPQPGNPFGRISAQCNLPRRIQLGARIEF